eukprot:TRINITY_DN29611_c0_g1_i1.p1 TRINITY_DN29611_c0_g1~~TRINITY_DN29611_c0_g1_i1.p1  ORF type:complete len:628 (+),score=124.45 TRINITY_DN29611_c0_g1_i1:44-1927(+)
MAAFVDTDFFGDPVIGNCKIQNWRRPFQWRRVGELHKKAKLFDIIQADNIRQGELGDCWLLAAVAVMADFPGHIMNLFDETALSEDGHALSEDGRYTIKLHHIKQGWQDIVIDDLIPCDCQGKPLFAQLVGDSGCMWALLLEKAFAKFVGSYEKLVGGSARWAWQVLTGQPWMAHLSREHGTWNRWDMAGIQECFVDDAAAERWRTDGMRGGSWKGPAETLDDDGMFKALASYAQANYPVSCSIGEGDKAEEERPDGLLAKHAYSLLQVVSADGHRLVQVRNPWGKGGEWKGAWSDNSEEWRKHPHVRQDLCPTQVDDGRFWMPWEKFAEVFGGNLIVCPVTLPCPRNSSIVADERSRGSRCPQCRQPYTRAWVMLVDEKEERGAGTWKRIADGQTLCFLCLRATCRASSMLVQDLRIAGVHMQPKLTLAPPKGPRRQEICKFGAACYRRNPKHFHENFHPSLLPPAPACQNGCGRSAATGFKSCCKQCSNAHPVLNIVVPGELHDLSGRYEVVEGKSAYFMPVWRRKGGRGWLYKGHSWMMSFKEDGVGSTSGNISGKGSSHLPHLVGTWQAASTEGWKDLPGMRVEIEAGHAIMHTDACDVRDERERQLTANADAVLSKFHSRHR